MKKIGCIIFFLLIFYNNVFGLYILEDSGNARAVGLGGAFAALSDDTSAIYYNPALLYDIDRQQISVGYARNFLSFNKLDVAYIYPKISFKPDIGLSVAVSSAFDSGIPVYNAVEFGETGEYALGNSMNYYENLFLMGGGIKIKNIWMMQISGGLSFQFINRNIDDFKSYAYGINAGVNFRHRFFNFSIVGKNIFMKLKSETAVEDIPVVLRVGSLIHFKRIFRALFNSKQKQPTLLNNALIMQNLNWRVNPVFDMDFVFDKEFYINFYGGIEGWLNEAAAVRIGYNSCRGLSVGISVNIVDTIRADYAYLIHSELEESHRITVTYYF